MNLIAIPGAGQWMMKHKMRGAFWGIAVVIILFVFFIHLTGLISAELRSVNPQTQDLFELYQFSRALSSEVLTKHDTLIRGYIFALGTTYILSIADLFWIRAK